jgi:hypothetical protein
MSDGGGNMWLAAGTVTVIFAALTSALPIVARVFAVNIDLGILAVVSVIVPGRPSEIGALMVGAALVAWLLATFERGRA